MLNTRLLQLVYRYVTTSVFVKVLKRSHKMLFPLQLVEMDRRCNELAVINRPTVVHISLSNTRSSMLEQTNNTTFK